MKLLLILLSLTYLNANAYQTCTADDAEEVLVEMLKKTNEVSGDKVLLKSVLEHERKDGIEEYIFVVEGINFIVTSDDFVNKGDSIYGIAIVNKETCELVMWAGDSDLALGKLRNIHVIKGKNPKEL